MIHRHIVIVIYHRHFYGFPQDKNSLISRYSMQPHSTYKTFLFLLAYVSVFFCIFTPVNGTVIGIDFGTDWMKIAIVKPGGILETVLNKESKRKTSNIVNLRNGIRHYGSDAVSLVLFCKI